MLQAFSGAQTRRDALSSHEMDTRDAYKTYDTRFDTYLLLTAASDTAHTSCQTLLPREGKTYPPFFALSVYALGIQIHLFGFTQECT